MKRISIGLVAHVLALVLAVASTGCFQQTSATEATSDGTLSAQPNNDDGNSASQRGSFTGRAAQTLELTIHPTDDKGGPSPEPWETQQGPSPEPWNGHAFTLAPDPNPSATKP